MKLTAVEWLMSQLEGDYSKIARVIGLKKYNFLTQQAKEMDKQQKKDAYQHGRDDENCALSDGAMCPDYENADEWYKGEYGGEA